MIDDGTLDEAIKEGNEQYKQDKKNKKLWVISVDEAREMGVMPLKDVGKKAE